MINSELESKLELSAADFADLLALGEVLKVTEQLNVYYDCDSRLANEASTFRIRFAAGSSPVVTLKVPRKRDGALRESLEIEQPVAGSEFKILARARCFDVSKDLPESFASVLNGLGVEVLSRIGWMRNTRWLVRLDGEFPVELDRTSLPDGTIVHEAEIETPDMTVHEQLIGFICQTARSAQPSRMSKFERFSNALNTYRTSDSSSV